MASTDIFNMADTWNAGGTTFTAIKMNVTDTASAAGSLALDLQMDSTSIFSVGKNSTISFGLEDGTNYASLGFAAGTINLTHLGSNLLRFYWDGATGSASTIYGIGTNRLQIAAAAALTFASGTSLYEIEGIGGGGIISIIGYDTGSSQGRPMNITTPVGLPVVPLYVSGQGASEDIIRFRQGTTNKLVIGQGGQLTHTPTADLTAYSMTGFSLTGSNAQSMLDFAGTWNTTGEPIAIKISIVNTASGTNAKFVSFLEGALGTTEVFSVGKSGQTTMKGAVWPTLIRIGSTDSRIYSASSGVITLYNAAETSFDRVQLGGTTSSFPSLKRSGAILQARLADDSDFTDIQGKIRVHANAAAETPTATHTMRVFDAAGTEYKVLCVAA